MLMLSGNVGMILGRASGGPGNSFVFSKSQFVLVLGVCF